MQIYTFFINKRFFYNQYLFFKAIHQLHSSYFFLPPFLPLFFASGSEARAKAERRHSVKTNPRLAISRPFSNAKIVRNNDITNFFEQKMSLFPLLKKRGSHGWQKRLSLSNEVSRPSGDKKSIFPKHSGLLLD